MTKRLLSGIQPSGQLHIGNYFGAMKQFVELQQTDKYECFFPIVDLHTLTSSNNAQALQKNTLDVYLDYLAIGIDPDKALIFKQSSAPQVTELTWIFSNLVTLPWLERAHAFKDKTAKGLNANVGLFTYPILMASDILIANADIVPVGEDQRQHIEMTREIARKFNDTYQTDIFTEPTELIRDDVSVVPGLDGAKMSKSYGNTIPLFADREQLHELSMKVVTASTPKGQPVDPESDNVYQLYKLVATDDELTDMADGYQSGTLGFKEAKERLVDALNRFITPMRERRDSLNRDQAIKDLGESGKRAFDLYQKQMHQIRKTIGLMR